jgi:hypothetical protein
MCRHSGEYLLELCCPRKNPSKIQNDQLLVSVIKDLNQRNQKNKVHAWPSTMNLALKIT